MRLLRLVCTLSIALLLAMSAALEIAEAQRDFSQVQIRTQQLADGVYMLMGAGGNIGVSVGEDGVFLIDDQFAPLSDKIKAAVAALSNQPIRFVLNTHWHGDHTGGNENMGAAGVLIVAHDNVRKRMSVEQFISAFGRTVPAAAAVALPVVTFTDAVTFHLNRDDIYAFHVDPAHTDGDSVVHFRQANVIHAGDVFFNRMYPFIDVSSGGSIDGVISAVDAILKLADDQTKIVPGHGPLSDRTGLEAYRHMLQTIRDRVRQSIMAGQPLDNVVAANPTAEFDAVWGQGFLNPERFVTIVYTDLSRR